MIVQKLVAFECDSWTHVILWVLLTRVSHFLLSLAYCAHNCQHAECLALWTVRDHGCGQVPVPCPTRGTPCVQNDAVPSPDTWWPWSTTHWTLPRTSGWNVPWMTVLIGGWLCCAGRSHGVVLLVQFLHLHRLKQNASCHLHGDRCTFW